MIDLKITDVRAVAGDGAFLLDNGKTAVLYDTGFAFTGYRVAENVRKVLGKGRVLDYILLTHSHYDHAAGSAYIRRVYPDVKVVAGAYAAKIFAKPTARALMRELDGKAALSHGVTEYEDLIDELRADITVEDGDLLVCGDMTFSVIALPGHTKCSVGYYLAENKLLLSSETLGVYFGDNTYLPSYLVGYGLTLASFSKAEALEIEEILLPHFGVVRGEAAAGYFEKAKHVAVETAESIQERLRAGQSKDEILRWLREQVYKENVSPVYPIDAFLLNTEIMIGLIERELLSGLL